MTEAEVVITFAVGFPAIAAAALFFAAKWDSKHPS